MPDRAGEHRVVGQTLGCALDLVERFGRAPPFLFQNAEYFRSQCLIGNKFGVPLARPMSALASTMSILDNSARKNGHSRFMRISRSMRSPGASLMKASTAEPKPNQPGR